MLEEFGLCIFLADLWLGLHIIEEVEGLALNTMSSSVKAGTHQPWWHSAGSSWCKAGSDLWQWGAIKEKHSNGGLHNGLSCYIPSGHK